jgi:biotin synthase
LLTTGNPQFVADQDLFARLQLEAAKTTLSEPPLSLEQARPRAMVEAL